MNNRLQMLADAANSAYETGKAKTIEVQDTAATQFESGRKAFRVALQTE